MTVSMMEQAARAAGYHLDLKVTRIPRLADAASVAGDEWADWSPLRAATDWAAQYPNDIEAIIADPPATSSDRALNLLAAVAEKLAHDHKIAAPPWAAATPPLAQAWRPAGRHRNPPAEFLARNLFLGAEPVFRSWTL
jgi:hypothetical protein